MKFKKIPLFGQDSSPQNTSNILALIGTSAFWLIFLICMIIIKPKPQKPMFKEIQIVLSQDFTTQKTTPIKEEKSENQEQSQKMQETQKTEEIVQQVQNKTPQTEMPQTETAQKSETITKTTEPQNSTPKKTETKAIQKTQAESKPVKQKEVETAKPKNESKPIEKTEPVQKNKIVDQTEPVEYAKSVEELMAEQMASKKKKKEFDWDKFKDEAQEESSPDYVQTQQKNPVKTQASPFSGEARVAAEKIVSPIKSESVKKEKNASTQKTSSSTANALAKISNTSFKGNTANGISGQTEVQTEINQDGHVKLKMSNGNTRALLEPVQPVINLSQNAASTIDGSRTVKIRFKVVESGNVPVNEIQITPASMLTQIVRNEIIEQISKWRFESADYVAFAEFDYKIIKQ